MYDPEKAFQQSINNRRKSYYKPKQKFFNLMLLLLSENKYKFI